MFTFHTFLTSSGGDPVWLGHHRPRIVGQLCLHNETKTRNESRPVVSTPDKLQRLGYLDSSIQKTLVKNCPAFT